MGLRSWWKEKNAYFIAVTEERRRQMEAEKREWQRKQAAEWERKYVTNLTIPPRGKGPDTYSEFVECLNCRWEYNIRMNKGTALPLKVRCPQCEVVGRYKRADPYAGEF